MNSTIEPLRTPGTATTPTCTFFQCFQTSAQVQKNRISRHVGVQRDMNIMYQQPHLVQPMKLTVYGTLPATPRTPQSHVSTWVSSSKNLASRASLVTRKSRAASIKAKISKPTPIDSSALSDLPFRRRQFRPIELSIYVDRNNRLSDLPEFDRLSFTDVGDIKMPAPALVRSTQSAVYEPITNSNSPMPRKPASMFEGFTATTSVKHSRKTTASTINPTSRPASAHDSLHSHPVSLASLPHAPAPVHISNSRPKLTPMQEEFSPLPTSQIINGLVFDFPPLTARPQTLSPEPMTKEEQELGEVNAISQDPKRDSTLRRGSSTPATNPISTYFHPNYTTQKRISQWLASRSYSHVSSPSASTINTTSTSSSFAEHRRKRSQFYQLSAPRKNTPAVHAPSPQHQQQQSQSANQPRTPPTPLDLSRTATVYKPTPYFSPQHKRTRTESTYSTVDTDIVSDFMTHMNRPVSPGENNSSSESLSTETAPTTIPDGVRREIHSRAGTIKSVSSYRPGTGNVATPSNTAAGSASRFMADGRYTPDAEPQFAEIETVQHHDYQSICRSQITSPVASAHKQVHACSVKRSDSGYCSSPAAERKMTDSPGIVITTGSSYDIANAMQQKQILIKEIGGPLRSPGIGVAF